MSLSPPTPLPFQDDDNEEVDFGRFYGLLIDHRWFIITLTLMFASAGIVNAVLSTPIYRADSLVQIEETSQSLNPLTEVSGLWDQEPPTESEIWIIRSRMVLGRAVDILNLDLQVEPKRLPLVGDFLNRREVERPAFVTDWDNTRLAGLPLVSDFLNRTGLEIPNFPEGFGVAWAGESIQVGSMAVSDDYLGKPFSLKVIDDQRYSLSYQGERLGEGRVGSTAEFMNGDVSVIVESIDAPSGTTFILRRIRRLMAIASLRNRLDIAEQGRQTGILEWRLTGSDPVLVETTLRTIADIYVAQNKQRKSEEARKSLEFLNGQVPTIREDLRRAEDVLNAYRTERDSVDLSLETQSILERLVNLEAKLNELEFTEAEISRRFTTGHPTYAALLEKKGQLQNERTNLEDKINNLPETQQEILRMQRDVSVTQEIYVQLLNKVQEMQIAEASTVGNVRVLDDAEVFPEAVEPNKKMNLLIAGLLGLVLAVGWVLLRAAFNRGVETPEEIDQLGLPVYATIPLSDKQEKLNRRIKRPRSSADSYAIGLLAESHPADGSIEALRGLRTSLHFAMLEGSDNRLLITGPSPDIGKSFICVNLAAVCAQLGQRVLVIDSDMRKGHIHSIFGAHSEGGLSEALVGRKTLDEIIRPVSGVENLHYIARGIAPPNPSELLASLQFTELLDSVSERYDLVIIDSPPVLAVTDGAIISNQVGTTLLVARFQLNTAKEIQLASQRLETAGGKVNGVILNALERKAATTYGYGYYHYSYK